MPKIRMKALNTITSLFSITPNCELLLLLLLPNIVDKK